MSWEVLADIERNLQKQNGTPNMSKTIYQLSAEAQVLDALLDEHLTQSGGEMTLEIEAIINGWLDEQGSQLDAKLDAYAAVIAERTAVAAARKAEAQRFRDLAQADENTVRAMKERLRWFFETRGMIKHETTAHKFTLAANGGKAPLEIIEGVALDTLPARFTKLIEELDKDEIRAALEGGEDLEFARLGERGKSVRIR